MADEADLTAEREEKEAPARLLAARKPVGPAPIGACLSCEEVLPDGHRWCDQDCRTDWEKAQFARAQRPTL